MLRKNNNHIEHESSESDISDDEQQVSALPSASQHYQQYTDSDQNSEDHEEEESLREEQDSLEDEIDRRPKEEEEDSDEEQEEFNRYPLRNNGIPMVREASQENSDQDDSIDHIEERIKKLERDLENRLGKHTTKDAPVKSHGKETGKVIGSRPIFSHPPIPTKVSEKVTPAPINQNQNRMALSNEPKKQGEKLKKSDKFEIENVKKNVDGFEHKNKKVGKKQTNPESKAQVKQAQISMKPKGKTPTSSQIQSNPTLPEPMSLVTEKKIQEMQRAIQQLTNENKRLKQQLRNEKQMGKNRKKPVVEELEKLKEISTKNEKLEKELQLLQVIQKLQGKLKKSIGKKLASNTKMSNSSTLLHKGLPASLLNNH